MLIAVASKNGKEIDQHFGHAEHFLVFDVNEGKVILKEELLVERYCSYDPDHPLRRPLLEAIAHALKECRAVVCMQIGQAPRLELERLGIDVYTAEGPIEETLLELARLL